jgi:hypothetical protein
MPLEHLIAETNALRANLAARERFSDPAYLRALSARIATAPTLARTDIGQCVIEDLQDFEHSGRMARTKAHINEGRSPHVFSLFNASYFPTLSLDLLAYRRLDIHDELSGKFPSNTCPIVLEGHSAGFDARVVVALFPENHIDNRQEHDDRIFYFIDKFVERHVRITQKMIRHVMRPDSLPLLREATTLDIERAASHWVWLHEYHHRQGHLPLPQWLPLKSLKPLAGLEELRVDLSGLLVCLRDADLPPRLAHMTYEFILAERLLRYPVEGSKKPNYDAVASQVLFQYLLRHGGLALENGRIALLPELPEALASFLAEVTAIEATIAHRTPAEVQQALLAFVNGYVEVDPATRDYRHDPFFWQIKQALGV